METFVYIDRETVIHGHIEKIRNNQEERLLVIQGCGWSTKGNLT